MRDLRCLAAVLLIVAATSTRGGEPYSKTSEPVRSTRAEVCSWQVVGTPNLHPDRMDNALRDVAVVSADDAWAIGSAHVPEEGGDQRGRILHWDGASWRAVANPRPGATLMAVAASSATDAWIVGFTRSTGGSALHWNGTNWSPVGVTDPGTTYWSLDGVAALAPDDVWVVGNTATGRRGDTLVEHWDGERWEIVPSPSPPPDPLTARPYAGLDDVSAIAADDLWAVGHAVNVGGSGGNTLAIHWGGSSWDLRATNEAGGADPPPYTVLNSVSALAGGDVWSVGFSTNDRGTRDRALILRWDGTVWEHVSAPRVGKRSSLNAVAVRTDDSWAVGGWSDGVVVHPLVERWDGTSWTVADPPIARGAMYGIGASSDGDLWAVGSHGARSAESLAMRCLRSP
jgi:hypothetical protein